MTVRNIEIILNEIDELKANGDFRRAYELWQDLEKSEQEGRLVTINLNDIRAEIEREASLKRQELTKELDKILDGSISVEDFDEITAKTLVNELEKATLSRDLSSSDYATYDSWLTRRIQEKQFRRDYKRIYEQVQYKWEEGESLTRDSSNLGQENVLLPFEQALEIINDAVSTSPDNKYLKQLQDQAKDRRERFAEEEEIMTSGGQTGDFVVVLKHISKARDDEFIMVYDNAGGVIGRQPKEEARQTVIDQARPFIRDNIGKYIDVANRALEEDRDPRRALEELKKIEKFEELRLMVPDIIRRDSYEDYQNALRASNQALSALERAEEAAEKAVEKAVKEPKDAWADFEKALAIYPDSEEISARLSGARQHITERTTHYLEEKVTDISLLIEQRQFGEAQRLSALIGQQFETIPDIATTAVIDRIVDLHTLASNILDEKRTVTQELSEILRLADNQKTSTANEKLSELRSKYDRLLLQEDVLWQEVTDRVEGAVTIEERLSDLQAMLEVTSVQQVTDAIEQAQKMEALQRGSQGFGKNENERLQFAREFKDIGTQLGFYKQYLDAEMTLKSQGHREAIKQINQLLYDNRSNMSEVLRTKLSTRLTALRGEAGILNANADILQDIKSLLQQANAVDNLSRILGKLSEIDRFINEVQRQEWLDLSRRTLGLMTIQTSFNRSVLGTVMQTLERVDPVEYDIWIKRLHMVTQAQEARDRVQSKQLDVAREIWDGLKEKAGDEDIRYIFEQISDLNRELLVIEYSELFKDTSMNTEDESSLNIWRQTADDLLEKLKRAVLDTSDELYRLSFMQMAVDVEIRYAQQSSETKIRSRLENADAYALQNLEEQINTVQTAKQRGKLKHSSADVEDILRDAKKTFVASRLGNYLGLAVGQVQEHLTVNAPVDRFKSAYDTWTSAIEKTPEHMYVNEIGISYRSLFHSVFATLLSNFKRHKEALQKELQGIIAEATQQGTDVMSAEIMSASSKLILLDPHDSAGNGLITGLASLGFQLKKNLDTVIETLPNARGFEGDTPQDKFLAQQQRIAKEIDYVQLIFKVSEQLPDGVLQDRTSNSITDMCRNYLRIFEHLDEKMKQIQVVTDDFSTALNGFSYNKDTYKKTDTIITGLQSNYRNAIDETANSMIERFRQEDVKNLNIAYDTLENFSTKHPWMQERLTNAEELKTLYNRFTSLINFVSDVFADDDIPIKQAQYKIADYKIELENEFRFSSLFRTIEMTVDPKTNKSITGWTKIVEYVNQTAGVVDKIEDWSSAYFAEAEQDEAIPPSMGIVNWAVLNKLVMAEIERYQQTGDALLAYEDENIKNYIEQLLDSNNYNEGVRYQAEYLLARGEFSDATELIRRVLHPNAKEENLLDGLMSLTEADAIFSNPPLADGEGNAKDYNEARAHAGSEQGKKLLTWMEENRFRLYREHKADAIRLQEKIDKTVTDWEQIVKIYRNQLITLGKAVEKLEKSNMFNRSGRKNDLCKALEDAEKTTQTMTSLCPLHVDLVQLKRNSIVLQTEKVLQDAGGCG